MILSILLINFSILTGISTQNIKTLNQKLQQEPQYQEFNARLLKNNREAKLKLHYEEITIFVPENAVLKHTKGDFMSDSVFYYMSYEYKTLEMLNRTNFLSSVLLDFPPIWVTKAGPDLYVNNAKIIKDKSDVVGRSRLGSTGKKQILHVIDSTLDPIVRSTSAPPNAYDFLASFPNWRLGDARTVTNFLTKIHDENLQHVFRQNAGNTYFIPVDAEFDPYIFNEFDKNSIFAHVVPFRVLFTRPALESAKFEALANDEVYVELALEEKFGKTFVKGTSRSGSDDGEFESEILVPNIPVKNGVVHLISRPLGAFARQLRPFPYVSVLEKLSTNPEWDVFYRMGQQTGFNKILTKENISFTYFVPHDSYWIKAKNENLEPVEAPLEILGRHLVQSTSAYSIEQLELLTKANSYSDLSLPAKSGPLRISVMRIRGKHYVKWNQKFIEVLRANYECSDGIIHVISGPLTSFRRKDPNLLASGEKIAKNYWEIINKGVEYLDSSYSNKILQK